MLIVKTFTFDAAHKIAGLPKSHKCSRVHGHTYRVDVGVSGAVIDPKNGFLAGVDFADIDTAWNAVNKVLDHRDLNRIPGLGNPTCENVTVWIMEKLTKGKLKNHISSVRVYESSTTYCSLDREEFDDIYSR